MQQIQDDLMKRIKERKKIAEDYLLDYDDRRMDYIAQKKKELESFNPPADANVGGGKSNLPGHPVESAAIRSAQYDESHDEYYWIESVRRTIRVMEDRKRVFYELRCEAEKRNHRAGRGRRGWVLYVQRRYSERMAAEYMDDDAWISVETAKRWWHDMVNRVADIHAELKNIKKVTL